MPSTSTRAGARGPELSGRPRRAAPDAARVPLEHQIRRQAPPDAVGYRLVLPLRGGDDLPHVLPLSSTPGAPTAWCLDPFEPPDDLRLQDGKLYRLLFVDERGLILDPKKKYIPALRFFLGPPEPLSARQQREFVEVLDRIEDPQVRDEAAEQILAMRLEQTRRREETQQASRRAREQVEQMSRQAAAMQKQMDTMLEHRRQQAREEAERARAEAAASRARMPWVLGSVTLGAALLGVLAAWLGPKLAAHFKSLPSGQAGDLAGKIFEDTRQMMARVRLASQGGIAPSPPAAPVAEVVNGQPLAVSASSAAQAAPTRPEPAAVPPPLQPATWAPDPIQPEEVPAPTAQHAPERPNRAQDATDAPSSPGAPLPASGSVPALAVAAEDTLAQASDGRGAADSPAREPAVWAAAESGLTEREREKLALIVCDTEKPLYVSYEFNRAVCRAQQRPEPVPPSGLLLSDAERRELAQIAADPLRARTVLELQAELYRILKQNPERVTSLPPPFRSLSTIEVQRIHAAVRQPEQRRYLTYALQLCAARACGEPLPNEPPTSLSSEVRRQLRKLPTDTRSFHYMAPLLAAANQAELEKARAQ